MGRFLRLFFVVDLMFTSVTLWAAQTTSVPLGTVDREHSEANLTVTRASGELTTLSMVAPNVVSDARTIDYRTYQAFGIPGEPFSAEEGSPTVPFVFRFVAIPNTGSAELVITGAEYDLVDNVNSYPVQPENSGFMPLARNEGLYSRDGWYPSTVAELTQPMIMRDFRLVGVTLHPVQVNPVTHQARIYRNLTVDVVANNTPGENELLHPHQISGAWVPRYRSMISNLDDSALDDASTTPGGYLIICNTDPTALRYADSLFQWKTRKGFKVVIDSRSTWTSSSMVTAIRSDYLSWNPPLEYVALMGDPESTMGVPTDGSNYDHSFGLGNAGDDIEDIGVGRLSCSDGTQFLVVNAKIMKYERDPVVSDTNWAHKAFLYAGVGNNCAGNYTLMRWAEQQFERYTGVNNVTVGVTNGSVVDNDVQTQIAGGVGYFIWRGSWVGQMSSALAGSTAPNGRLPVTFTVTCGTGDFQSGTSISEGWLLAGSSATDLRGGICGIGTATLSTHNPENVCLASGLMYNIADLGTEALGDALAGAKAQLYYTYGTQADPYGGTLAGNFSRYCNLMGEPSLSMWTDAPEVLSVSAPTALNIGTRSVDVTVRRQSDNVPVSEALVVLWKRGTDSTWVKGLTDVSGHITLPVNVRQAGSMYLTVTKRNHKPYLYTIPCSQATVMPMLSTYTVDDDNVGGSQGNGDHILNPSETIDLPVYIRNFGGSVTATGISATLTSTNPRVTVVSGTATYANLAPGDSALGSTPFRIQVAADLQSSVQTLLNVTINSSAGQTVGAIPLTSQAGVGTYMRQHLAAAFNPGSTVNLQVVVKNTGTVAMTGVTGHLVSGSTVVSPTDADAVFGDIPAGVLDSNTADVFTVYSSPLTFRGHQAPMSLILTTSTGFVDTVHFVVSVGTASSTDPTGPESYGYFAYDNSDVTYDLHPTYSYVDISGNGTNLNLADPGDKTTPTPVYSAALHLPFSFKFYGRVYDSLTVCANGWCAFGNQAWYDGFRNYQLPAMQAPEAMIAPYWDDLATSGSGRGVWVRNDATGHRYIVQWKAGVGAGYSTPLDFEVILYDTTFYPTASGDGKIAVQYNTVTMNMDNQYNDEAPGCTIGLQAPGGIRCLQYAYEASYASGAATVQSGRAILFTTEGVGAIPAELTLLSPEANTVWYQNSVTTVSWYGGVLAEHIRIDLSRSGVAGPWENVVASVNNSGLYNFTVSGPPSTNCLVRISSVENPTDADTSNGAFTISAMRLFSPNGGDLWMVDSSATVTWAGAASGAGVRIELCRAGANGPWEVLSASTPNTGTFTWTVTGNSSSSCRVRVTSLLDATDTDISDANFSIGVVQTVFSADFESGAGAWNHSTVSPWRDEWNISTERAHSGTHSWKCGDTGTGNYLDSLDARLVSPVINNIPDGAMLTYQQQIESEWSPQYPDSTYDGGILEIADNGGAFTQITPVSGYPRTFRWRTTNNAPYSGPMPGLHCFSDSLPVWMPVQIDLTPYTGHSIQVRWRFGTDAAVTREGWYVDDVVITAPFVAPPAPEVPISVTCYAIGNDISLRWAADDNTAYRIYSAATVGGPYTTLEGTTTSTSFTIPNGASNTLRFYIVVGWDGQ